MQNIPPDTATTPGMSSLGRSGDGCRRSSIAPPMPGIAANTRFTYKHQRQDRYSVSRPPRSRPTAPPAPTIAPNTPNALPRSLGAENVVVSSDSAEGAISAPNAPWAAPATTSIPKLVPAPPPAHAPATPDSPSGDGTLR